MSSGCHWTAIGRAGIARVDRDAETFASARFVNPEEVDDDRIEKRASVLTA
ncbi:hypothetical protein ACGF0D_15525 [Kitasatospora sp. NPDC048298]|uniref:hypothetical protein n=1 Tax=Kitasatospora sp. NPDC048298 TaxID=3364049 RepID=UPI003720E3F3